MRVMFRFKPEGDKAWVGFVEGRTWDDIFHNIDEFGDPYSTDVIKLPADRTMSFCVPYIDYPEDGTEEGGWDTDPDDEIEVGDWFYEYPPDSPEWEKHRSIWEKYLSTRVAY